MKQLLDQARKRVISHLLLDKGALAVTIGMGGVVLLLLIGTQILNWYWPVLLAALSLGVGIWQLRKFIPSRYELAQRIDRKMSLADSLSTAVYFSEHPKQGLEGICAIQARSADALASGVSLEQALPLTRSRFVIPAAILFVAASGLFFTRYLVTGSLDLRSSLIDMVVDNFFSSPAEEASAKEARPDLRPRGFDPSQPETPGEEQLQPEMPPDAQKGNELKSGDPNDSKSGEGDKVQDGQDEQKGDQNQEGESSKDGAPQNKQSDQQKSGGDQNQNSQQSQDQRSLFDKMRDAVNNLMNKMSSEPQKGQKGGDKQQAKNKDKGEKNQDKGEKSEGDPQDSDQPGDQSDQKDAKQSNAPGQKPSQDAKSGAGQDDGKKDIEKAEALEAMGQLTELLSERSAAISGDMLVEVGNTKQQLKTAMTQQKQGHTDAGGEIHRDQVPLAYQTFVDRYFQEVRKTAPKAPAKGK